MVYSIVYLSKQKTLKKLFHEIKFDWEFWTIDQEQLIITNHANHGRIYTIFYTGCIIGTCVTYLIMAVTPQLLDMVLPLNESRPKKLPFELYYFVNYSEDYFYWIMLHVFCNSILEMSILIASESILAVFTEHACAIFKIIGLQLRKINCNGSERNNLKAVIFCIQQHNRVIEFVYSKSSFSNKNILQYHRIAFLSLFLFHHGVEYNINFCFFNSGCCSS